MKILVIDDDEMNRKILSEILEFESFEVIEAETGKQGLEVLTANPDVQIILLDRMMPELDGIGFMREFSQNPSWKHIKVIMQTAANKPKEVMEGNATGVYYYLTKPFDEEIVMSIIHSAVADIQAARAN